MSGPGRTIAFAICATVAWIAVAYKVAALRRDPHNAALWALAACIALPAAGFTMAITQVYTAITRLTGVPNLATLLVYGCITGYSVVELIMLLLWHLPPAQARLRSRRLLAFYGTAIAAMVVLFARSGATEDHPVDFDQTYGVRPVAGAFLLVYVTAFGIGLGAAARRSTQFANRVAGTAPDHPWLRRGLRLVALGSLVTLGYSLGKATFVIAAWVGPRLSPLNDLAVACACLGALVTTTGFTIPSWGPRLSAAAGWAGRARAYLRLYPLWHTMYRAVPGIALDPPASRLADLLMLRDLDYRLYRRMVEIRDGRLALALTSAPAVDCPEAATIAERHHVPAAAVHDAMRIRDAVTSRVGVARAPAPTEPGEHADDLHWLVQVSTALRHLPVRN